MDLSPQGPIVQGAQQSVSGAIDRKPNGGRGLWITVLRVFLLWFVDARIHLAWVNSL
jgi:hypothetical protein